VARNAAVEFCGTWYDENKRIYNAIMNEPTTSEQIPEILWHYTSSSGLLGILDKLKIWASDLRFLNDATEDRILWERIQRRMEAIVHGTGRASVEEFLHNLNPDESREETREVAQKFVDYCAKIHPELKTRENQNNFVAFLKRR
jgi:hypothetical protein